MADEYILKSFDGGAQKTTLTAPFTIGGSTLSVANGSTFPNGSSGPFVIVVDRGLAAEEKFLIDTTSGVNGVIFTIQQAGYDGTTASNHSSGASVEHCLDAYSIEQSNRYVNLQTTKGDLVTHNGTTTLRVGVGTNNQVLIADSVQAAGIKWGQVQSTGIADGSIVEAKIGDSQVTTGKLADDAVTTNKIGNGQVTAAKIAAGAIPIAVPSGVISAFAGSAAPTGWLLCQGQSVSRTTYADLFTALGGTSSPYGGVTATNFNVPDLRTRVPVGFFSTDTDTDPNINTNNALNSLGKTGGTKVHTLVWDEMPNHNHPSVHTHSFEVRGSVGTFTNGATGLYPLGGSAVASTYGSTIPGYTPSPDSTSAAGSSTAHNNLQPYLVVNYIIKT